MEALQSALSPAGPDAEAIAVLGWILFGGASVIVAGVAVLACCAHWGGETLRRRIATRDFVLVGGAVFPAVTLTVLLSYGLTLTGARVTATEPGALQIEVSGEQWWWRVRYLAAGSAPEAVTANEIRIPTGRQAKIILSSADVIHSFWAPSLAGKVDMIPGTVNRIRLRATRAGVFRGQCAEFAAARTR